MTNMKIWNRLKKSLNTPLGILVAVAGVVLSAEFLFMALLHEMPIPMLPFKLSDAVWDAIDAITVTVLVTPVIYLLIFRKIQQDGEYLRLITLTAQDAIIVVNERSQITEWNLAAYKIFQYSREEALGQPLHQLITPPRFLAEAEHGFTRFQKNGEGLLVGKTTEIVARRKDGSEFPAELSISAVKVKGRWHAIGITRDITERKEAEEKLRVHQIELKMQNEELQRTQAELDASHAKYVDLYDLAPVGYCTIASETGLILQTNLTASTLLGVARQALIKQKISNFILPEDQDIYYQFRRKLGASHSCELRMVKNDGTQFWANLMSNVEQANDGVLAARVVLSDITEHKRAEAELLAAKVLAEEASRAKSAFLARMGHELLTPLNAIIGFAQVMEASADDEIIATHRDNVKTIVRSGWQLHRIIKDLLSLSEIESRKVVLHIDKVDACNCLTETCELIAPLARERGVELHCAHDGLEGAIVLADPFRLHEVLTNLLDNAIKYNRDGGSVTLSGQQMPGRLRILVTDTGQGIPESELSTLFQPFSRLAQRTYSIEGAGVGLSIARQLTELMGGTIGVESVVGQGSTFWIELPAANAPETIKFNGRAA